MNIKTKVITTIIAMVCSLSVSATGIVAILMEFPVQVANTTSIAVGEVQGDLYGRRKGGGDTDLSMLGFHLFKNGEGIQQSAMDYFCQDVSFSLGSKEIEYVFMFVLAEDATNGAMVELLEAGLSNNETYSASYKVGYGSTEPNWNTAEEIAIDKKYVVSEDSPRIWLNATLKIRPDQVARIDTSATWSFKFEFSGLAVNN